ncbi:MAG TPA: hypothetical protein VF384_19930 [Planctomycetota bacterium]
MRAAFVLFVLLVVVAAAGWLWLSGETGTVPVPEPPAPRAATPRPGPADPERSAVAEKQRTAATPQPEKTEPSSALPPSLPLAGAGRVELNVRDVAKLTPVPAFRWRFRSDGPELRGDGAEGGAKLSLPAGAVGELLVEADGYSPFVRAQLSVPAPAAEATAVDVLMTPTVPAAGITLLVHDTSMQPIGNVRVDAFVLTAESRETAWHLGKPLWARRTAMPNGRYTLPPLPAGEYGIRVTATDAEGNAQPLLPYSRTFVLTGDNGYVEDVTLEAGCLPVFELVDGAGAFLDPQKAGAVALSLHLPGGPDVPRWWVVTSGAASAMAIGALPGVGPVRLGEAVPGGVYTFEVTVAGNRRVQHSVSLRAGEKQQERIVVP